MSNYRRALIPGGSFFFTVVVHRRRPLFADPVAVELLGSVFRRCILQWPFKVNAIVLLPDHLHAIWSLPPGDSEYPKRWGWLKKEFTRQWLASGGSDDVVFEGRKRQRRRGIWQPRYWEHTLEDEDDFETQATRPKQFWSIKPARSLRISITSIGIRSNMAMSVARTSGRIAVFIDMWS